MKTAHHVTRPWHAMSVKDSEREDSFNKDAYARLRQHRCRPNDGMEHLFARIGIGALMCVFPFRVSRLYRNIGVTSYPFANGKADGEWVPNKEREGDYRRGEERSITTRAFPLTSRCAMLARPVPDGNEDPARK